MLKNNNLNKKINKPVRSTYSYRTNNKNMNKDLILPLIAGLLLGAMIMILWQFNARLNNVRAALVQLNEVTTQNTNTVNEVVNFINQASGQNAEGGATQVAPAVVE